MIALGINMSRTHDCEVEINMLANYKPTERVARAISCCVLLFFAVFSTIVVAQPTVRLEASRLSGPAPLAVLFDATATSHSDSNIDTFRQLGYYFDFDDVGSGNWATSGLSKNTETGGPLAAHVFDNPGNYRVAVRARDAAGLWSDAWINITVTDPNTVFSGSNTVVISRGSNFSGAPAGAQQIANASSWPTFRSNTRYLLKAGDDFSSLGQMFLRDVSDFQITSFGSGAKPRVANVSITMDYNNAANPPRNGVVQNLETLSIREEIMFEHLLVYGNTLVGNGAGISNAGALTWYAENKRGSSSRSDWKWSSGFYVVENYVDMNNNYSGPRNPIQGGGKWWVALGNRSTDANEHTMRAFYTYKSVFGHNEFTGMNTTGGRHALKMHAMGTAEWSDYLFPNGSTTRIHPRSRYVRIHNNIIGNANSLNVWTMQVAPQDDGRSGTVEGLQDFLIESNTFVASSGVTMADIQTLGHNIIERGSNRQHDVWTTSSYPSNYPNDAYWHGPYFINDSVPAVSPPERDGVVTNSPPMPPVLMAPAL
jgi:hypothetical protein